MKPAWAAKVLSIDLADLPRLDRPWTKRDVRRLRDDRPQWLTEARKRHAKRVRDEAEEKADRLDAAMAALGYNDPDLATVDQAVRYVDRACVHLMATTGCSEQDAEAVAWNRWPKSMAAEEDYAMGDTVNWWG